MYCRIRTNECYYAPATFSKPHIAPTIIKLPAISRASPAVVPDLVRRLFVA